MEMFITPIQVSFVVLECIQSCSHFFLKKKNSEDRVTTRAHLYTSHHYFIVNFIHMQRSQLKHTKEPFKFSAAFLSDVEHPEVRPFLPQEET